MREIAIRATIAALMRMILFQFGEHFFVAKEAGH
jgi:hypothetical protein